MKTGLWEKLQSKYVFANNVRQVLQFVESGNVQAGLVYITDAKTSSKVKVVQTISDSLHDPITYPIAVVNRSPNQAEARAYTEFLASDAAKTVFRSYGFVPL
jgi:molybdate transport system substrate-binding protein